MRTTFAIELPEELACRLDETGISAADVQRIALAALSELADSVEVQRWWASLTPEQQAAEAARTRLSLADADQGRVLTVDSVMERVRSGSR